VIIILKVLHLLTETACENGFVYKSTCYKIHRERVNWFTAVNRCLSNNGSLAVFDDDILTYFATSLLSEGPVWVGYIRSFWIWPDAGLYPWQYHQQVRVVLIYAMVKQIIQFREQITDEI